jgi:hypothetical protein
MVEYEDMYCSAASGVRRTSSSVSPKNSVGRHFQELNRSWVAAVQELSH